MIYDEEQQEYRPRFGYKGANSRIEEHAIVELKPGMDETADPWSVARAEKKRRVEKNLLQRVRNVERATGKSRKVKKIESYGKYLVQPECDLSVNVMILRLLDPAIVPGIPLNVVDKKAKKGKVGVRETLRLAQVSTASMGRLDFSH
jgi:hypothetical protein